MERGCLKKTASLFSPSLTSGMGFRRRNGLNLRNIAAERLLKA
jgi:hypothetical protein